MTFAIGNWIPLLPIVREYKTGRGLFLRERSHCRFFGMLMTPAYRLPFSLHAPSGLIQVQPYLAHELGRFSLRSYPLATEVACADEILLYLLADLRALYRDEWFDRLVYHEPLRCFLILANMSAVMVCSYGFTAHALSFC